MKDKAEQLYQKVMKVGLRFDSDRPVEAFKEGKQDAIDLILSAFKDVAREQRNRDRAVYSLNRTRTSIEIKQAILDAPLVTESLTKQKEK